MTRSIRFIAATLASTVVAAATIVRADDVYKFGANGQPQLKPLYPDVTILRADEEKLYFRTRSGSDLSAALASVIYVDASDDAVFTAADQAYATRDYEKAIDGYAKVLKGADNAWKVRYAAPRMLIAATKADRFDAALDAWIAIARLDPKSASTAKPKLPAKGSRFLDDAARSLDAAARGATNDAERQALLAYLLDVQVARGDATAAGVATDQLAASTDAPGADPKASVVGVETRLTQARAAMQVKRYDVAISTIDGAAPLIVEPGQQAESLYLLAEAKAAIADASGDAVARRDAAIAYLRVVAHFTGEPSAAGFVTRSLLAAARLDAGVGDVAAARALYDQLRSEYPSSPAAAQAAALAAKLPADPTGTDSPTSNAR